MPRKLPLPQPVFRIRLSQFMQARNLDARELARHAGVSHRTVRKLVNGESTSASQRTLARLASVLGTSVEHLTGADDAPVRRAGEPPAPRRVRPAVIVVVTLVVLVAGGAMLALVRPRWTLDCECGAHSFAVVNARNQALAWRSDNPVTIGPCVMHRWAGDDAVIYGTVASNTSGGMLIARRAANGDTLWTHRLSRSFVDGWYDRDLIDTGRFQPDYSGPTLADCRTLCFADIDGDGEQDMVVRWQYVPWYPTLVTWYSGRDWPARGEAALHVYRTSGRILLVVATNLDDDTRPEIVLAGTNNSRAYQGAMLIVLDDAHWSGATVDSLATWSAAGQPYDGSLDRVVFPAFDDAFMFAFGLPRLDVSSLAVERTGKGARMKVSIGDSRESWVTLMLDERLDVLEFSVEDAARTRLALTNPALAVRFDDAYIRDWLARRYVFHAPR